MSSYVLAVSTQARQMHAAPHACGAIRARRASRVAGKGTSVHQQGWSRRPVAAATQSFGVPHNGHRAVDIGVAALGRALCATLGCPGILGHVSRLVVDLNREEDAANIIPSDSDGHPIPGNALSAAARQARIDQYWRPYHDRVAIQIAAQQPKLLISLHSFTPQ